MLKIKGKEGKGKKPKLLDSSSSSESESEDKLGNETLNKKKDKGMDAGFSINKNYAGRYDNWRNLEEMQKLKSRLGVKNVDELNDEDSSESSTEEEEEWSTEKEKAFLKTLACLKKKDPKIYDGQFGYFKEVQETPGETKAEEEVGKKKKGEKKPFTVRDHERVMVLEKGGQHSEDEEDDTQNTKSYPEEMASIKSEFSKALKDIDSSDEEESGAVLGSNLLKKRAVKSEEEQQQEKEEYKLWLKGELEKVEKGKLSKEDKKDLKFLKEYWNDDKLDEGEKFLRDYILNKNYIEPLKANAAGHIPSFNEVVHDDDELSDDEKFEAEREEFEHKYNFRFEEPDQEFIKRYPRTIQDSLRLRKEEGKRKETRDKAKERKEEAKSRKREEVQRLKALKRKEILDKIEKLHEVTGDPDLDVREMDLEGDFDPEEYDKRMQQIFNDDYYQEEADGEKPVFPYDEELDNEENFEEWAPSVDKKKSTKENSSNEEEEDDDDDANEQSKSTEDSKRGSRSQNKRSIQEELIEMSKGKQRNRRKRSAFLEALEREKPQFDPKVHKSFEQYFDEYYKLDFEDLVGDLPCRFKYHKTTPNNFGLSVDEILKASDRELNQWASIKKTFQYREENEEQYEVKAYMQKAQRDDLKRRLIPSVYQRSAETTQADSESNEEEEGESEKQKKKRKKKNKKKNKKQNTSTLDNESAEDVLETADLDTTSTSVESSPPKKVKKIKTVEEDTDDVPLTDSSMIPESSPTTPVSGKTLSKRQRKNLKRKSGASNNGVEVNNGNDSTANMQTSVAQVEEGSKKKKKQSEKKWKGTKRKSEESNDTKGVNVDDARLEAYGLNPKKFKKRLKYGASVTKS